MTLTIDPSDLSGLRARLSARERDIAALVSQGLSNKEIASSLRIAPGTVQWNLHRIFTGLGVCTRSGLSSLWVRYGDQAASGIPVVHPHGCPCQWCDAA